MEEKQTCILQKTEFDNQDESCEDSISGNFDLTGFRWNKSNVKMVNWVTVDWQKLSIVTLLKRNNK